MNESGSSAKEEGKFHTYATHRIPWYVHALWISFWLAWIWYVVQYVIPSVKSYF